MRSRVPARIAVAVFLAASPFAFGEADEAAKFRQFLAEAHQLQARGDFGGAASRYEQALKIDPSIAELWANLGLMQFQAQDYTKSAESLKTALRLKPELFVPNLFLGLACLELKQARDAVPYLLTAHQLNPRDLQAVIALGRAYSALQEPGTANDWYSRAVALDAQSAEAWHGLGVTYLELSLRAAAVLTRAHRESTYFQALAAETQHRQGRFAEAIAAYRKLLASDSAPACSYASLGFALLGEGDLTAAEREFRAELENAPGCALARIGLARLKLEQGYFGIAVDVLETLWKTDRRALEASISHFSEWLSPEKAAGLLEQLRGASSAGRSPGLAGFLIAAIEAGGVATGSAPAAAGTRTLYIEGRRVQCGVDDRALSALAESELLVRATCAFVSGDYRTASTAGRRLTRAHPQNAAGWYWGVKANQNLAVAALLQAGELAPDSPRNHLLLGDAYRRQHMYSSAADEYGKALALAPDNAAALLGLAAAFYESSKLDEARSAARRALERGPADPDAILLMAEILVARHEYLEAEHHLKAALAKPNPLPRLHALLGRVYAATDRNREAVAELKLGLDSDVDGSVHYQLGRVYQRLGDSQSAAASFERSRLLMKNEKAAAGRTPGSAGRP